MWLDQRLAAQGTTADEIVRDEHQRQGAMNVTVRNVITSMRLISDVDWARVLRERQPGRRRAARRQRLRRDGFPDAQSLRHAIEELARGSGRTELEIARRALASCQRSAVDATDADAGRERDPGYYLIAGGRRALEQAIGFRAPLASWLARVDCRSSASSAMSAAIAVVAAVVLAAAAASRYRGLGVGRMASSSSRSWPCSRRSDLAVALVNRGVTE